MSNTKLSSINRLSSPMHGLQEDLNDTDYVRTQKIKSIKSQRQIKSPYSIGSVVDVETKLQNFEEHLANIRFNEDLKLSDADDEFVEENKSLSKIASTSLRDKMDVDRFAGVFAVASTVRFNRPIRLKKIVKKTLKPKEVTDNFKDEKLLPKFIELYHYNEINKNKVSDLPGSVKELFILKRVYRAQKGQFIPKYSEFFKKWFYCSEIQHLLKNMFWFFYLAKHGNEYNKHDLTKLFDFAADNYALFLNKLLNESQFYINKFQKKLPDLLSQALYTALSECFPDSWVQFNDEYIENIIVLVFFWLTGTRPTKGLWRYWDMQELKPTEQKLKEKKIEEQSKLGYQNYEGEENKSTSNLFEKPKTRETLLVGPNNTANSIQFNLNGISPLIQYFYHKMNINMNKGTNNLINYREVVPLAMSSDSETYYQVLLNTNRNIKEISEAYKKFHKECNEDLTRFNYFQRQNNQSQDRKVAKLLENRKEVHRLSNLLMHEYWKDKDSVSFKVDMAISESLSRIN